eukprot:TRINITY_DN7256_c0_g1_i2.p1 TRINITY_DN7256_c0_g1~~TRINITY_DN7256_c0_g1_i2.p1  ORF type:complete len:463 (+),score=84.54 TRINITY_DN7256_c0_g1_i2:414-1802(+)
MEARGGEARSTGARAGSNSRTEQLQSAYQALKEGPGIQQEQLLQVANVWRTLQGVSLWDASKIQRLVSKMSLGADGCISENEFVLFFDKMLPNAQDDFNQIVAGFMDLAQELAPEERRAVSEEEDDDKPEKMEAGTDFWGLGPERGVVGDYAEPISSRLEAVAECIREADFLLIAAGAGFSAPSGLPVYKDVADLPCYKERGLEYSDLARPSGRMSEPDIWYGFMGWCFNEYRKTAPHPGYQLLKKWCHSREGYVYTSNVDGHFRCSGFEQVCEIHGCMERWLCVRCGEVYALGPDAQFTIDPSTRLAVDGPNSTLPGQTNHPRCVACNETLRPDVVLFTDEEIKPFMGSHDWAASEYQAWEAAMEEAVVSQGKRMAVLELGCGIRVPSVRVECEEVIQDTLRQLSESDRNRVSFIRVNPDFPLALCKDPEDLPIPVQPFRMDALSFLSQVDSILETRCGNG